VAAARELVEETTVADLPLVEFGSFGTPGRDPRGWVVSIGYLALAPSDCRAIAGDDARHVQWQRVTELPALAFDHKDIIHKALNTLAEQAQIGTLPLALLAPGFRTQQARELYAQIIGRAIAPRTFKAWLRRRQAVQRVGPGRFKRRDALTRDWLQP